MHQKRGAVFALFDDLKGAFETVDRNKTWEYSKKKKIREYLADRMLYKNTTISVKVKKRVIILIR